MARAYGEYKQKYDDTLRELSHFIAKLKQTEEESKRLKDMNDILEQRFRDLNKTHRQNSNEFEFRESKLTQPTSLGSFLDQNSPEENVSEKKSYLHTPDGAFSPLNPLTSLPSYSPSSVKADTAPIIRKTSAVHDQVMLIQKGGENRALEESKPSTPRAVPRVFRHPSSSNGAGIERYNPDVLTVFQNKTQPLIYNTSSIKTTNLSYLKKPDSHRGKQVLVKIKGNLRVGYLRVVFSKKHSYLNKTEMIAGILLQEPVGTSNGVYESTRYFECPANHAVFVSIREVYVHVI